MSHPNKSTPPQSRPSALAQPTGRLDAELLIVSPTEAERCRWTQRTEAVRPSGALAVAGSDEAIEIAMQRPVEVALVSVDHHQREPIMRALVRLGVPCVAITNEPTLELATCVMREGAADLLSEQLPEQESSARILAAARRSDELRSRSSTKPLEDVCRTLNQARHDVTEQVGTMCDDLVNAYEQITEQVESVRLATEFGTIIRQELDIESLLRTVLEFMLAKTGPTNTALYLPASGGDYSLSAFVNYDCPRESGETMMEHLADAVPAAMEHRVGAVTIEDADEMVRLLGDQGRWLCDHNAVTVACHDDSGECLAVVFMFRDRLHPFSSADAHALETMAPVLADQLARLVRVHRRHLPVDPLTGMLDNEDDAPIDEFGLEGDSFGFDPTADAGPGIAYDEEIDGHLFDEFDPGFDAGPDGGPDADGDDGLDDDYGLAA